MKPRNNAKSTDHDLFCDFPITKGKLAQELGIARSTIGVWSQIALYRIAAFREAYPKDSEGNPDIESPLSPYQSWVLVRVGRLMDQLASANRVRQAISKNPNYFSIYTYRKAQENLTQLSA
ncbi:hypothetical protein [Dolichospermum sp. UHCC 0259]|uniref:hypothetical protein n=1 Tax=Dolichospermum sp. UHCC 0259 TaxID=2590010 RepID=UPI0015806553|nr:hypothetical protein [Dolichospermum sp. UHCC 0259]